MSTDGQTAGRAPIYARLLRLRRLKITGLMSFLLLECTVAVAILLALAELVSWWAVPLLPVLVAVMVKVNDMVGGPTKAPVAVAVAAGARSSRVTPQRDDVSGSFFDEPAPDAAHDRRDWDAGSSDRAWDERDWNANRAEPVWEQSDHDTDEVERAWDEHDRAAAPSVVALPVDRPTEEIMLPAELTGRAGERQAVMAGQHARYDGDPTWAERNAMEHAATTEFQMISDEYLQYAETDARAAREVYETQEFPGVRDTDDARAYGYGTHSHAASEPAGYEYSGYAAHDQATNEYGAYNYETREHPAIEHATTREHVAVDYGEAGYAPAGYATSDYDYAATDYAATDYAAHRHAAHRHAAQEPDRYGYTEYQHTDYQHTEHQHAEYQHAAHEQVSWDANSGRHAALTPDPAPAQRSVPAHAEVDEDLSEEAAYAASMAQTVPAFPVVPVAHVVPEASTMHAGSAFPAQAVPAARSTSGGSLAAAGSALTARGRSAGEPGRSAPRGSRSASEPTHTTPGYDAAPTYGTGTGHRAESGHGAGAGRRAASGRGAAPGYEPAASGHRDAAGHQTAASRGVGAGHQAVAGRQAAGSGQEAERPVRQGSHAASYWSRVAAGGPLTPPTRPEGGIPPNLPGAAAPRRAQLFGAAVRRSMAAQAQQIGSNALGGTTRGSRGSANDSGRHSRVEGNGSRQVVRFNDRGFGRLRDA